MKKIAEVIGEELQQAFCACGYDARYALVTLSNRPDLCEFQCNGALAAAKEYKKAPIASANEVVAALSDSGMFEKAEAVMPGFINLILDRAYVAQYVMGMRLADKYGVEQAKEPKTIVIDYGGANVAKPLHVGHLRPAIIGESIKRMKRFIGHKVIGDAHLGDWGLQIGLILTELHKRMPDLVYFDENYEGDYPEKAPFTISELEEIYPAASAYSKEHEDYKAEALQATVQLQQGRRGYRALWNHILEVSIADLKVNYTKLGVSFDLWKKESDAQPYIPDMVEQMVKDGFAYESDGALVVDVKEETDTKEVPPCLIRKSDGGFLYATTDLATIVERKKLFDPDQIIYVADKRQEMHFTQVFRCAKKTGLIGEDAQLTFLGFGTMNGKDGKPFKTRDGGVMRLETLMNDIEERMLQKMMDNENQAQSDEEHARETARMVALSAVKYGDLCNQASKDYIFDEERFTSFEGNTGPYILYTMVRIKSILKKYEQQSAGVEEPKILPAAGESEKTLMLALMQFAPSVEAACEESVPHKICAYIYELANAFNHFYHQTKILAEEDKKQQASWIQLLVLTRDILDTSIALLGFEAPERM